MKDRANENSVPTLRDGAKAAWPICLGYFPIGLAFGVIAGKAGLSPLDIGLMSLLVFAGSAQFIAVSMLGTGAGLTSIVMTTFVVNLRHLLMSSSLSLHLKNLAGWRTLLYAYGVTDESFAVNLTRFREGGGGGGLEARPGRQSRIERRLGREHRAGGICGRVHPPRGPRHRLCPHRHVSVPAGFPAPGSNLLAHGGRGGGSRRPPVPPPSRQPLYRHRIGDGGGDRRRLPPAPGGFRPGIVIGPGGIAR